MADAALISGQNIRIPSDNAYCLNLHVADWQWRAVISRKDGSIEPLTTAQGIAIRDNRLLLSLHDIDSSVEKLAIYINSKPGASTLNMSACLSDISEKKTYASIDISTQLHALRTINVLEIYLRNNEWKIKCVMQGFKCEPNPLLTLMGMSESAPLATHSEESSSESDDGVITLAWKAHNEKPRAATRHFMGSQFQSVTDLRIGCLYELDNGQRGIVYSLDSNVEGSFNGVPYIKTYRETNKHHEQLRINLRYKHKLHRYLVFITMVESFDRWDELDVSISFHLPGTPGQKVFPSTLMAKPVIAVAMMDFSEPETNITPVNEYFTDLVEMDRAFGWGLPWRIEDNLNDEEEP